MERELEPRRHPDPSRRLAWGLYCRREDRWLEAAFSTEQAAREAIPILARSTSR